MKVYEQYEPYVRRVRNVAEMHGFKVQRAVIVYNGKVLCPAYNCLGIHSQGCRIEVCWHTSKSYSEFSYTRLILEAVRFWIFVIPLEPEPTYFVVPTSRLLTWLGEDRIKKLRIYRKVPASKRLHTIDLAPYKDAWYLLQQNPEE